MELDQKQNPPVVQVPAAAQPVPAPQQHTPQPTTLQAPAKSNPWPWIVGGCLMIVILIIGTFIILGWWGARTIKKQIQENSSIQNIKESVDKMSKEGGEWQIESEKIRTSIPDPEDIQKGIESSVPPIKKK